MLKEEARKRISELVAHFHEQIDTLKQGDYNETQTRIDFINPFFKALGWDVDNENGYAEAYREVIHEDKTKVKEGKHQKTKAPDYAFRLGGGKRLFFVEAKKPSVYIKDDIVPAYQLRRYGWSARLPISIITDFEEFAVYDCTKKPYPSDKASTARIKYITYKDYDREFDFLWDTFSKEKVLTGSFDRFVQSDKQKRGTETVDKAFLVSLDEWRKYLATNIAWNNKNLNEDEINYAVQMTIDRIIFLRITEDRFVERYGRLKECLSKGIFYRNLFDYFKEADKKYNSGLFDFAKDKITEKLVVENKVIISIVNELYPPESPFEFSEIPVEILGSAYEQFLGKVIRLTPGHIAKIDEKPEVRKAGGVYYTPQYIVEYIVENTVGKLIVGKSPAEISKLKIVDPACGSGSFLIGAYQHLLTYHKDYYSQNGKPSKGKKDSLLTPEGNLTTAEKKRILTNNIYGVDIDVNAVEVTKLSLLLKCMEGETEASIATQMKLFHERVLPTLDNNIKDGNSLIDTDYYDGQIDFGDEKKIKPFNWQRAFPEVFNIKKPEEKDLKKYAITALEKAKIALNDAKDIYDQYQNTLEEPQVQYGQIGGFDVVIGNPPYVMLQNLETREVFNYALAKFSCAKYKIDTYQLFVEQSIKLLKYGGLLGFITPNTFLKNIHAEPLRKFILENVIISEILLFKYPVFAAASVDTCIFIFEKGEAAKKSELAVLKSDMPFEVNQVSRIRQLSFIENNRADFNLVISGSDSELLKKITKKSVPLKKFCGAYFGIQTFDRKKYVSQEKINNHYEPVIDGGNIAPYLLSPSTEFVNFIPSAIKSGGNETIYRQDRICIRQIGAYPLATFVPSNIFTLNTIYNVFLKEKNKEDIKFLLGIINSKTTEFFWRKNNSDEKTLFPKIKKEAILSIPIPEIGKNKQEKSSHDEIVKNVDLLLKLNEEKQEAKLQTRIDQLQTRIDYAEEQINKAVYKLYDLTEDEIKIVEAT